jgi:hypothetical protein
MRLLGIGVLAIVLAGCGGAAAPTAQGPASTTAAATTAARETETAKATAPATAAGPNIADALKAGKLASYKVTYKWSTTVSGQTSTSEQTWYYKPPNARFDLSAGPGATFSIYALSDATYVCTTIGGTASCQKSPGGQDALTQNPAAAFALQLQEKPDQFNATFTGTQSIAGQQAQCYTVKGAVPAAVGFGDATTCYSSSGVPLKTTMTMQGMSIAMEATEFSTKVSDADFVVPTR